MKKVRKLIAAVIGMAVLVGMHKADVTIPGFDGIVIDIVVSALTAIGVYQTPNEAS